MTESVSNSSCVPQCNVSFNTLLYEKNQAMLELAKRSQATLGAVCWQTGLLASRFQFKLAWPKPL